MRSSLRQGQILEPLLTMCTCLPQNVEEEWTVSSNVKTYHPYVSPFDPCPPICVKTYVTPPNLYIGYQPMGLPQFSPSEALKFGTLWPALYGPYEGRP